MLSITSYKLRKLLPWLAALTLIVLAQCYFTSIRNSSLFQNAIEVLNYRKPKDVKVGPSHVLLLAYARTGSSFVGDLLQSFPETFYHFEPLHIIESNVFNSSFNEGRNLLNNLFTCNISSIPNFMKWQEKHPQFMKFQRNIRYWSDCRKNKTCYDGHYIDKFCNSTSIRIAKTIRFTLIEASKLFTSHPNLNLKLIYLTRDPRGTMNSRTKKSVRSWCRKDPLCHNPNLYCSGLHTDVEASCALYHQRPEDFMVLRYEDVSMDPLGTATLISRFLGFDNLPNQVREFLKTHTFNVGNPKKQSKVEGLAYSYTTVRNSSITAMNWRKEMSFSNVTTLQKVCREFLIAFGYHWYETVAALRSNVNLNSDLAKALKSTCDIHNT